MSQTLNMTNINELPMTAAADLTGAQLGGLRWFTFRPAASIILASGSLCVFAMLGMVKLSDKVLESNAQTQAMAAAVPPAEYYKAIANASDESPASANESAAMTN